MRIGLVVTGGFDRSGRERVVPVLLSLAERLARRHEVHVFALHHDRLPSTYELRGATVHDLGRVDGPRGFRRLRLRARLARALGTLGRFDVLHAYWGMPAGLVTTQVARRIAVPTIVTLGSGELVALDDIQYGLQRRWIDRRAIAATIRAASRVTVATSYMAAMPALRRARVEIVPVGPAGAAACGAAPPSPADGPPWRLLRVASLNRVKDYPTLLHAMRSLVDRLADVHLDIVGEDTLGGAIQALCRRLALDDHVTFHGFQPTDALAAFYARADVHVSSSRHEAAGVVTLEAACAGLATVGTSVGYLADWAAPDAVRDGPARGVAVPVGDPDALAAAIADLLQHPRRRAQVAAAAHAWATTHDADWTAGQFERIYHELAGRR